MTRRGKLTQGTLHFWNRAQCDLTWLSDIPVEPAPQPEGYLIDRQAMIAALQPGS